MKLWEFSGKRIRVTFDDGQELVGVACDYTSALDNEPDPESISIDTGVPGMLTEIYACEIKSIEVLK